MAYAPLKHTALNISVQMHTQTSLTAIIQVNVR